MTGYTSPLTAGVTILPSYVSYQPYAIPAGQTLTLNWPVDNFPANANVVALLMNVTPGGASCNLQMPSALNTSTGEKALVVNTGSFAFTVVDSTGATIVSIASGAAYFIALTSNATAAGTWLTFQFGAGTSSANSAALAGAGLAANGPFLQQVMSVTTVNANYSATSSDRDNFLNWTGGAGTITLPLMSTVGNNFYFQTRNSGSGTETIAASGSDTINGAATLAMNINDSCFIVTDGSTGWYTIGLGAVLTSTFNFLQVSLAGQTGTYVLPSNQQNKISYRFTGALAGATNIQVPSTIQQYWVDNETTGGFALGIGTSGQIGGSTQFIITNGARFILYCDSSNVLNAVTASISTPVSIAQGGTGATTAATALSNLGGTSTGIALFETASASAALTTLGALSASDTWAFVGGF